MFVCICNGVTDSAIRKAAADGVVTLSELTIESFFPADDATRQRLQELSKS